MNEYPVVRYWSGCFFYDLNLLSINFGIKVLYFHLVCTYSSIILHRMVVSKHLVHGFDSNPLHFSFWCFMNYVLTVFFGQFIDQFCSFFVLHTCVATDCITIYYEWMNILPTLIVESYHVIKDWISMTVADNVGHMFGLYIPHPYMCVSTGSSETHAGGGMSGSVFIETPLSKTHYHQHYYYVRQSHLPSPWSQTFMPPRHPPRTYCTFWIWILPLFCQWLYVIVNSLIIQLTFCKTKYT